MENKKVASVAERLREALSDAGKTQADLMRETGLQRSAISRYLAGSYEPKAQAVGAMARVLCVSEMWLFGYDVPKSRTVEQKKNDDLVGVIAKLRKDPDFFEVVSKLASLPPAEYASIKQLLSALSDK